MQSQEVINWQSSNFQLFWGEIAPCDHVVQIYENDKVFLESLEGFVGSGLLAGDSIILIATPQHLEALAHKLTGHGLHIAELTRSKRYIAIDAQEALSKFMINDWPDETLFMEFVSSLLQSVDQEGRKIRAFGEMVALLWQKGLSGATVQLENLWNKLHHHEKFTLFCAYPRIGFTQDISSSIKTICAVHSKIIDGSPKPSTDIYYKEAV